MVKVSRKETKELAALVFKSIKTSHPHLSNKEIRAICSTLYAQLKEVKNA